RCPRNGKADPGIDAVIGGAGSMPKAGARNDVSGTMVGELGGAASRAIDGVRAAVPDWRLRRAAGKMQRGEGADCDLVGIAAGDFSKPRSAVEAFDGDHVRNAIAHEDVADVILKIHPAQSGKVGEPGRRPLDQSGRLVELIEKRGAADVDVNRTGEGDA